MKEQDYRVYGYRWVVLAIYGLCTGVIQLMWTTFFSITTDAWKYYGFTDATKGESAISLLSIIFMAGMIIISIPSLAAFERFLKKRWDLASFSPESAPCLEESSEKAMLWFWL